MVSEKLYGYDGLQAFSGLSKHIVKRGMALYNFPQPRLEWRKNVCHRYWLTTEVIVWMFENQDQPTVPERFATARIFDLHISPRLEPNSERPVYRLIESQRSLGTDLEVSPLPTRS